MRRRLRYLLLLIVVCVLSCGAVGAQTVKFSYYNSLIFIPVKVNNVDLLFLLNTGANATVVDKRIAEKLSLAVTREVDTVTGTAGKEPVTLVMVKSLAIGTTVLKNTVVTKRDLGTFITMDGQKIDGILGTDVLKQFALTIDYNTKRITFQKTKVPAANKKRITFDMRDGIPRFEARLNDTLNTFLHMNTGVSLLPTKEVHVNVSPKQWEELKGLNPHLSPSKYLSGSGVGGGVYLQAVKINKLELNHNINIYNSYIILQPKEGYFKEKNAIGFFGNNLLEKYGRVSVDFLARQILLPMKSPAPTKKTIKRKKK